MKYLGNLNPVLTSVPATHTGHSLHRVPQNTLAHTNLGSIHPPRTLPALSILEYSSLQQIQLHLSYQVALTVEGLPITWPTHHLHSSLLARISLYKEPQDTQDNTASAILPRCFLWIRPQEPHLVPTLALAICQGTHCVERTGTLVRTNHSPSQPGKITNANSLYRGQPYTRPFLQVEEK